MPLAIHRKQASGAVEFSVITDSCKEVENLSVVTGCIAYAVGCDYRQAQRSRYAQRSLIAGFFISFAMTLQLDVDILRPKDANKPFENLPPGCFTAAHQRCSQRAFISAGQTDET